MYIKQSLWLVQIVVEGMRMHVNVVVDVVIAVIEESGHYIV